MKSRCRLGCVVGIAVWLSAVSVGVGQERAERLRFNAEQDTWEELPALEAGTAAGDLALARAAFAGERYREARRAVTRWMKTYGAKSELYPRAILLEARVDKARRDYYLAYRVLTELLDEYGGTEVARDGAVEMFNIAEVFLSGVRRKVWGMRLLRATDLGLDILDDLAVRFPDTELAEQAIKTKADHYFARGDFGIAELEYSRLAQSFPRSRYRRYAMRRSADAALASYRGIRFDDAPLVEAEERYRDYTTQFRGLAEQEQVGLILADIEERRAAKEFDIGAYYDRTHHRAAAVFYYRSTMQHWPDTIASRKAVGALRSMGEDVGGASGASAQSTVGSEGP